MKLILLLLLLPLSAWANIGSIKELRGQAFIGQTPAKVGDLLHEGDLIRTEAKSLAILSFNDQTKLTLGPKAKLKISTFKEDQGKRDIHIKYLQGQIRTLIKRHALQGEKLRFDVQLVTLGVRGTEFITNAYSVGGAPSTDTILLEGSLQASGTGFESFVLKPGEYFNSQEIVKLGTKAIKKLSEGALKELKSKATKLGNPLQSATGFTSPLPLVAIQPPLLAKEEEKKPPQKEIAPLPAQLKKPRAKKRHGFSYDLTKEPWDIRDAVMNRKRNKKENKCFTFFYKKLPGAGEPERFRRERDCDEFEFDL